MSVFGGGHAPPIHYLFVDAGYLRGVLERKARTFFGRDTIPIDYASFFSGGMAYNKKFYYDSLPHKKTGESNQDYEARIEPRVTHHNSLRALDSFHVHLGTTTGEGGRARQKGVDTRTFRPEVVTCTSLLEKNKHLWL